jgi:hypothetical protein
VGEASALRTTVEFRTIDELAVRCGHYCWLEHQLFVCTGRWASAPAATGATAIEAEIRVCFSAMSSWHGFLAGQWRDRLPIRAGIDAAALIVPPSEPIAEAFDLLGAAPGLLVALGALVDPVLPALRLAYEQETTLVAPTSERPVIGLLDLARPATLGEIEAATELRERAAPDALEAQEVTDLRGGLQRLFTSNGGIFPAASAS